jgi:hypothetical protein
MWYSPSQYLPCTPELPEPLKTVQMPYKPHLMKQYTICLDVYLSILQQVDTTLTSLYTVTFPAGASITRAPHVHILLRMRRSWGSASYSQWMEMIRWSVSWGAVHFWISKKLTPVIFRRFVSLMNWPTNVKSGGTITCCEPKLTGGQLRPLDNTPLMLYKAMRMIHHVPNDGRTCRINTLPMPGASLMRQASLSHFVAMVSFFCWLTWYRVERGKAFRVIIFLTDNSCT